MQQSPPSYCAILTLMPEPFQALSVSPFSLAEHLQEVTKALVAASTRQQVFQAVLQTVLSDLGAAQGAVLLVSGDCLQLADVAKGTVALWQDGPLDSDTPAGDALWRREAFYLEQAGEERRHLRTLASASS